MPALILAIALGPASAASAQVGRGLAQRPGIELGAAPHVEMVRDGCGRG